MSEGSLFGAITILREELANLVKLTNREATEQQISYRREYVNKMRMYKDYLALLDKEIDRQIKRVSDHIVNLSGNPV
jgi:uncharacterized protein YnzC (UPF0291/DUF896 family)